jgi:LmbE family N-acetylglucosaminyl deacetylase
MKILAFGAHPDDIEIGCGGTLLKLQKHKPEIYYGIFTSGEKGSFDIAPDDLAKIREKEALNAAKALSVKDVKFFNSPDGFVSRNPILKIEVMKMIRDIDPEIIFLHHKNDDHADHRNVYQIVREAISGSKGPWYPEAGKKIVQPKCVLGYEVWSPIESSQLKVDITQTLNAKIELVKNFKSQIEDVNYLSAIESLARYRGVTSQKGEAIEAFQVLSIGAIDLRIFF